MPIEELDPTKHSADRIVSNEDKLDPHFEKIKLGELTLTDLDLYLQIKKIREAENLLQYEKQIDELSSLIRKIDVSKQETREHFFAFLNNKLMELSLMIQRERYKQKKKYL